MGTYATCTIMDFKTLKLLNYFTDYEYSHFPRYIEFRSTSEDKIRNGATPCVAYTIPANRGL